MALFSNPSFPMIIFPPKLTKPSLISSSWNQTFVPLPLIHSSKAISACLKQPKFAGKMNLRGSWGSSSTYWHGNRKTTVSMMLQDEATTTPEPKDGDHDTPSESSRLKWVQDHIEKVKDSIYQLPMMLNDEAIRTGLWKFLSDSVSVLASTKFKIFYSFFKNIVLPIYARLTDTNLTMNSTKRPHDVEGVDAELQQTTTPVNLQCEEGTAIEDGAQEFMEMEDVSKELGSQN